MFLAVIYTRRTRAHFLLFISSPLFYFYFFPILCYFSIHLFYYHFIRFPLNKCYPLSFHTGGTHARFFFFSLSISSLFYFSFFLILCYFLVLLFYYHSIRFPLNKWYSLLIYTGRRRVSFLFFVFRFFYFFFPICCFLFYYFTVISFGCL